MKCLTERQVLRLVDDGVAPNEAEALLAHARDCKRCAEALRGARELTATLRSHDLQGFDMEAHVSATLERIRVSDLRDASEHSRRWWAWAAAALVPVATAAVVLLAVRVRSWVDEPFAARGTIDAAPSLARDVGVRFYVGTQRLEPLRAGATIMGADALTGTYTNLGPTAYALVFAVDAQGAVHWLYPAYEDERTNPRSVELAHAQQETLFGTSVQLDRPSAGAMRMMSLMTRAPLHVKDIENRNAQDITRERLQLTFEGAAVQELELNVSEH